MVVVYIGGGIYRGLSSDTKPTTSINGALFLETDNRKLYFYNGSIWQEQDATPAASGEANTVSNVGTGGIGVFKQKTGVDFELKNLISGSSSTITLTDDTGDNEIEFDVNETNILLSNLGGTLSDSQLSSNVMRIDLDNDLGTHYLDIEDIAVPANPSTGIRRLFVDTATGELSVRTSGGSTVSLEAASSGEANTASNVGAAGVGVFKQKTVSDLELKNINAGSSKITVTDDTANNEIDIDIGSAVITDSEIAAHTTTKITTTSKSLLNSNIVYEDEDNNLGTHYLDVGEIAAPATPGSDIGRLYIDSTSNNLTIKKDSGAVRDLELKRYPFIWVCEHVNSSANWSDGRQNPLNGARYNGENNLSYIVPDDNIVITRMYFDGINNTKDGTSTAILLDDGVAVPNTTLNLLAMTNARVDSGVISQSIGSGSKISIKTDTSASSSGSFTYNVEVHGYYDLT